MAVKLSTKLNFIGILAIVAGGFIGFWFLTIGLYVTLWAYNTNKDVSVFLYLAVGLAFSIMSIRGGIGVLRRHPGSRAILIVCSYLLSAVIALCIFSGIKDALQEMGKDYFDAGSWLAGSAFAFVVGMLCVFQAIFLSKPEVKELFKKKQENL